MAAPKGCVAVGVQHRAGRTGRRFGSRPGPGDGAEGDDADLHALGGHGVGGQFLDRKICRPSLSSAMGRPCMEVEVSSSNRQGQRGSAFSTNSGSAKGSWSDGHGWAVPAKLPGLCPGPGKGQSSFANLLISVSRGRLSSGGGPGGKAPWGDHTIPATASHGQRCPARHAADARGGLHVDPLLERVGAAAGAAAADADARGCRGSWGCWRRWS